MIFIIYILFLSYWALAGYSSALCERCSDIQYCKKVKIVRSVMMSLFTLFTFGLLYFYTNIFWLSLVSICGFFLGTFNVYQGFKFSTLTKIKPKEYMLGWFDSKHKDGKKKKKSAILRVLSLTASCLIILILTILKIFYL